MVTHLVSKYKNGKKKVWELYKYDIANGKKYIWL